MYRIRKHPIIDVRILEDVVSIMVFSISDQTELDGE
jgi:hypothetical protein